MRIILIKDVNGLGKKHEVKEVSPGYARNFLIPQKLAEFAAPNALTRVANEIATEEAEEKIRENLLKKNIEALSGKTITVTENANDLGHLFARIHQAELVEAIKKELGLDILPEFIMLEKPIKEIGKFEIKVKVSGTETTFTLIVEKKI